MAQLPIQPPRFSIIIPTYGRNESLCRTLESVLTVITEGVSTQFEVVVVRNDRKDDDGLLERFVGNAVVDVSIVCRDCPGLLTGRHLGLRVARGEILCYLDDDVTLWDSWPHALIEAFSDSSVQLVGGPSVPADDDDFPDWIHRLWRSVGATGRMLPELSLLDLNVDSPCAIDPCLVWGLNYCIRKDAVIRCGGFHPDCVPPQLQHFQGDGETGLSEKLAAIKAKCIYHPLLKVTHWAGNARITPQYFEHRAFYQGVCDSYSDLRKCLLREKRRSLLGTLRTTILRFIRKFYAECDSGQEDSRKTYEDDSQCGPFTRAYQRGWDFHRASARLSRRLRRWIAQEHYFDFEYPDLGSGFRQPPRLVNEPLTFDATSGRSQL